MGEVTLQVSGSGVNLVPGSGDTKIVKSSVSSAKSTTTPSSTPPPAK